MEDPHLLDPCVRRGVPSLRADNVHSHLLGRTETAPEGGIERATVPLPAPTGTQISCLPPSPPSTSQLWNISGPKRRKLRPGWGLGLDSGVESR